MIGLRLTCKGNRVGQRQCFRPTALSLRVQI